MDSLLAETPRLTLSEENASGQKQTESPETQAKRTNYLTKRKSLVDIVSAGKKVVWNRKQEGTALERFKTLIRSKHQIKIDSYWDLYKWSITNYGKFWDELFKFSNIIYSEPYYQVLPTHGKLSGADWFKGLRFNYTENFLKYRDDHFALICIDEEGREEKITYSELYEQVTLYAAAFRKHGLKSGDRVACYVSNREEPVFAMLACASIGALWGGLPNYGSKAATKIISAIKPKFLFTVDRSTNNIIQQDVLESLASVVNQVGSLERVIIVTTKEETLKKDISEIRNSCFLQDFLNFGRNFDGTVPELRFEQVPFDHPLTMNFTSGTTGSPKGLVHSQGVLLAMMRDLGLHHNFTRDDVAFTDYASGWIAWNVNVSTLLFGATLVLQSGYAYYYEHTNTWDTLDKYNVTWTVVPTTAVSEMEKLNIVPGPNGKLEKLRSLICGGSAMKISDFEFFQRNFRSDIVVGALYGSTEMMSLITGFDTNEPIYSGEIQVPALGLDLRIFNDAGTSVIGQRGEIVICNQLPYFPLYLLNDAKGDMLRLEYLSKFPDVWSMNDEGWIDPETRGLIVIGRSDDIFNPMEERFGSADIYFAIQDLKDIADSICVRQNSGKGHHHRAVLFVKMAPGVPFNEHFVDKIKLKIEDEFNEDFLPQVILEVKDIPYNLTGKKLEKVVSKIVDSNEIPEVNNVRNPECLNYFANVPELQSF